MPESNSECRTAPDSNKRVWDCRRVIANVGQRRIVISERGTVPESNSECGTLPDSNKRVWDSVGQYRTVISKCGTALDSDREYGMILWAL